MRCCAKLSGSRIGHRSALLASLGLISVLSGCNDTAQQKQIAETAAQRFQSVYNSGSCEQLYDNASRYFQAHETRARWLGDCDQLRKRFGRWEKFMPNENNSWPFGKVGIVWVKGPAQFENGPANVRLDWDLSNDPAALFNMLIMGDHDEISVPGFTGEVRK